MEIGLSAMVFHRANSGEMGLVGGGAESLFSLIDMFWLQSFLALPSKALDKFRLELLLFSLRSGAFIVLLLIFLNPSFVPHPPHIFASEFSQHFNPPLMLGKKGEVSSNETHDVTHSFVGSDNSGLPAQKQTHKSSEQAISPNMP